MNFVCVPMYRYDSNTLLLLPLPPPISTDLDGE